MPSDTITKPLPLDFVETLRECFSRGFALVPNTASYWHPSWCCFRLVALNAEAASRMSPRLRLGAFSAWYARRLVEALPLSPTAAGDFGAFLAKTYPGIEAETLRKNDDFQPSRKLNIVMNQSVAA